MLIGQDAGSNKDETGNLLDKLGIFVMFVIFNFAPKERLRVFSQMKNFRTHLSKIIWRPLVCAKERDYSNLEQNQLWVSLYYLNKKTNSHCNWLKSFQPCLGDKICKRSFFMEKDKPTASFPITLIVITNLIKLYKMKEGVTYVKTLQTAGKDLLSPST